MSELSTNTEEQTRSQWLMPTLLTVIGGILFAIAIETLRKLPPMWLLILFASSTAIGGVGLKLLLTRLIKRYGNTHVSTAMGVTILAGIVIVFLVYVLLNAE